MLAKKYRFHGHNSLRFVYTKGSIVRARYISIKYCKNNRRQHSRVAVVVSKKVTKKAPLRNRMRRRVYEVIRQQWANIPPGYDMVITIFDERVAHEPHQKLEATMKGLLDDAGLRQRVGEEERGVVEGLDNKEQTTNNK